MHNPDNCSSTPARPFSGERLPLIDNHDRPITYLRLAITDRCNLRCSYCMPEQGVDPIGHDETLSYEELERLVRLFQNLGVTKVRITGGEPFVRRGCLEFMQMLKDKLAVEQLVLTTNGVETYRYLEQLKALGISGINMSLDSLDRERFRTITRRDRLKKVMQTFNRALELAIPIKINSVVLEDTSDEDIVSLVNLIKENNISLRFIEQMPFSGRSGGHRQAKNLLSARLRDLFPGLKEYHSETVETARQFTIPGFTGRVGIIEGHSRNFCSSCNKVRITPQGMLKACLYDNGVLDLRAALRTGLSDEELMKSIRISLNHRYADGHKTEEANANSSQPSMATIGG